MTVSYLIKGLVCLTVTIASPRRRRHLHKPSKVEDEKYDSGGAYSSNHPKQSAAPILETGFVLLLLVLYDAAAPA